MPCLTIFRGGFVDALLANVAANLDKYRHDDRWLLGLGPHSKRDLPTRIEIKLPVSLDEPDDGNLKDLENSIRVHKLLGHLTPLQARDPRLWTRLAHVECWQYMRKRWCVEQHEKDPGKAGRYVVEHYFVARNESRALLHNGIARLWWTAHLSHDRARTNPYELTAVLLSTLDITQQLLERNMGRAPAVLAGFLEFLQQNRDPLLQKGDQNRYRIRKLAKFLNLYGGVCVLDCLTQTDVIKLLDIELGRIMESEKQRPSKVLA